MRLPPPGMNRIWLSGDYVGDNRPIARVTIANPWIMPHTPHSQTFTTLIFGGGEKPLELYNVKSVAWNRSIESDTADCTIELYNTDPMPTNETPTRDLDQPGHFTFNRGKTAFAGRWAQWQNQWVDRIVPDRVVRTYEGYGIDTTKIPENDPHLMLTGTWLIDDVIYTSDGMITLRCRDFGRLLLDQICFPPVIPFPRYPIYFEHYTRQANLPTLTQGSNRIGLSFDNSSNEPWYGPDGGVHGHYPHEAFDDDGASFWLSVGNIRGDARFAYEWVQASCSPVTLTSVNFSTVGDGYQAFLSVISNGDWAGGPVIDYYPDGVGRQKNCRVPYVASMPCGSEGTYSFNGNWTGVTMIRITLFNLPALGPGPYSYRAAIRGVDAYASFSSTIDNGFHTSGNYSDYTDIVKLLCAYGGFYWPLEGGSIIRTDNSRETMTPTEGDPALSWVQPEVQFAERLDGPPAGESVGEGADVQQRYVEPGVGRVWGDFENTGTYGIAKFPVPQFDKKPLMDGISAIRDIVGFLFYIDEAGGVVWRPPNIWRVGNYLTDLNSGSAYLTAVDGSLTRYGRGTRELRPSLMTTLDETQILVGLTATLSSKNIRETVFVATTNGQIGAGVKGYNPYPIQLRRVAGWTDQNFTTDAECRRMADLIVLRQLMLYRTDSVVIAGYPGIQIDDQVRIYEAVTAEGFIHYVKGISSSLDMDTGDYTYTLQTQWLGDDPDYNWVFDRYALAPDTQAFLDAVYRGGGGFA